VSIADTDFLALPSILTDQKPLSYLLRTVLIVSFIKVNIEILDTIQVRVYELYTHHFIIQLLIIFPYFFNIFALLVLPKKLEIGNRCERIHFPASARKVAFKPFEGANMFDENVKACTAAYPCALSAVSEAQ
jgi:hypothetical protein